MKSIVITVFVYALTMMMFGCQNQAANTKTVNVVISNSSTNDLNLVELNWQGPDIPAGVMPLGISKTSIGVEWPKLESAKLTFVNEKTREPYSIDLSFAEINKQIDSGSCRTVVIRIVSFQKAEVVTGD